MVVLVTAILVGLVAPRLGHAPAADPAHQIDRLTALLDAWCNRAVIQGSALGVKFESGGYGFRVPAEDESAWMPAPASGTFRPRSWAPSLKPRLLIEGRPVALDGRQPQITCHASGEMTPFAFELAVGNRRARLQASFDGKLRVGGE